MKPTAKTVRIDFFEDYIAQRFFNEEIQSYSEDWLNQFTPTCLLFIARAKGLTELLSLRNEVNRYYLEHPEMAVPVAEWAAFQERIHQIVDDGLYFFDEKLVK